MHTLVLDNPASGRWDLAGFARSLMAAEPRFFGLAMLLAAAALPTAFAALVDDRLFLGDNVWVKPWKFEVALFTYLLTLGFFARYLPAGTGERRWYRIYSSVVVAAIVFEMVWIAGAAALGTASHFNRTPVGDALYSVAGLGALILTTPTAVYAWHIARNRNSGLPPVMKEAIVTGLALVMPLTLMTAGTMSQMGGHEIGGVPGDGDMLAIMGWSRDGGDLRVAHFFATHALHFMPAFGLLSLQLFGSRSVWPVRVFGAAFVLFVVAVFAQALAGRPFLPGLG